MNPDHLYSVIVFADPGPRWYRLTNEPVSRERALSLVVKHWSRRRLVRVVLIDAGGSQVVRDLGSSPGQVVPFKHRWGSPLFTRAS